MDPDPAFLVINLQDANKKNLKKKFFCLLLFEGTFTSLFKDKKSKRSHKTESTFFFPFCLMIEGSGSIPLTNGSGSGSRRPKNIRIRIRNTASTVIEDSHHLDADPDPDSSFHFDADPDPTFSI
jgi:hypothetical protein